MKKCCKCKVEKPLTEFNKDKNRKDGHQYKCKSCSAKYYAKHYAENKEKKAQYCAENKEKKAAYDVKHNARRKAEQPNCVYQIKNLENRQ